MSAPGEREAPGARARAAGSELLARWRALRDAASPIMSAPALAIALILIVSLLFSGMLQFFTGVYDAHPGLSYMNAGGNTLLATALGIMMILRRSKQRANAVILALSLGVVVLSVWSASAKLQYQRGLQGNPFYALPHQPMRYPKEATDVFLRTSDGVRLEATLIANKRAKGVVIYPTWRTNRDAFAVATIAMWLSNVVDVLVIDPRGQGGSSGAKTPDGQEKFDILAGVAYMKASGHDRVGVLAEQDSALPAILAASMHQGIDSLALVAPSARWGESLGQDDRLYDPASLLGRIYWRVVAGLRLASGPSAAPLTEVIRFISPTPILITGSKTDLGSTVDQLHLSAGEPKSLIVLGGDGKPTTWLRFADYFQALEQWFSLTLRSAEPRVVPNEVPDQGP